MIDHVSNQVYHLLNKVNPHMEKVSCNMTLLLSKLDCKCETRSTIRYYLTKNEKWKARKLLKKISTPHPH
ncbi:hypothetical protein FFL34_06540 [Lentibacillus cibarius]|uniref:Uncharacterized protein n=1 Tax=Lentibacillus cibarius TaxID=2583219 RepID=A0A5S3QQ59_9BACI|nr:hypothetical protein FFL34_06540 [Lentibacillus cibarius]